MSSTARRLANVSIRAKLFIGFALLMLVPVADGALGLWAFSSSNAAFQTAVTESMPALDLLLQVDRDMQRALVAERSLMFTRLGTPDATRQLEGHAESLRHVEEGWARYTRIAAPEDERRHWPAFATAVAEWKKVSLEVVSLVKEDTPSARRDAVDLSMGEAAEKFERARKFVDTLTDVRLKGAERHAASQQARAGWLRSLMVGGVVVAVVFAFALSIALARNILTPLRRTVAILRDIASGEGDLTARLAHDRGDEIGELARWFNSFVEKLQAIMTEVRRAADRINGSSRAVADGTDKLAASTQAQAASLEESAASLEQISGTVKQNADNSRQASELAVASRDSAERGGEVVTTAVAAMGEINRASRKIADIISTIDEIAFQTNLLALNAAVEAARAGEQGRGFAVVAAEVRSLAHRAAAAAQEIKTLIGDSVDKVDAGSELVNRSGQTLGDILSSVKRVTDIIAEIADASREQSSGVDQVSRAVAQMDQTIQSTVAQTEEMSSTAQALAEQAEQLQALVGRFKLAADHEAEPTVMMPA